MSDIFESCMYSKDIVKENVRDRILQIMSREGLKAASFAESINVAQATLSQIIRGRNLPSMDFLLRLRQRYPDISLDWLLSGEGCMSKLENDTKVWDDADKSMNGHYSLPLLFTENAENLTNNSCFSENRKEIAVKDDKDAAKNIVNQEVIYKERPARKITEIRIFFDDNTYETFKPA